jgi:hypothetical protein
MPPDQNQDASAQPDVEKSTYFTHLAGFNDRAASGNPRGWISDRVGKWLAFGRTLVISPGFTIGLTMQGKKGHSRQERRTALSSTTARTFTTST